MANIATVSLRIIVKAGTEPIEDIEVLFALLGETSSYNVPIYLAWRDGYLDVQYGVRWSPVAGPYDLFQMIGDRVQHLFVRWYDGGGDFDEIYEVSSERTTWGQRTARFCRYGFDSIKFRFLNGELPAWASPYDADGWSAFPLRGSYLAGNCRSPSEFSPGTATTAAGTSPPVGHVDPPAAAVSLESMMRTATRVEWCWNGKTVRMGRRYSDRWSYFGMDDWSNCLDGKYLRALGQPTIVSPGVEANDRREAV